MSDSDIRAFLEGDDGSKATESARRVIEAGRGGEFMDAVLAQLSDTSPWKRAQILERVRRIPASAPLLDRLDSALRDTTHAELRNAARSIFAALASPRNPTPEVAVERLAVLSGADHDIDVRVLATTALGESTNPAGRDALEAALADSSANVAAAAADALGVLADERSIPALAEASRSEDAWVRNAAIVALGQSRAPTSIPALIAALREPSGVYAAAAALGEIGDARGLEALRTVLESGDEIAENISIQAAASILSSNPQLDIPEWLRAAARGHEGEWGGQFHETGDLNLARLLGIAGTHRAAEYLARELADPDHAAAATVGIGLLPPPVAVDVLLALIADEDPDGRCAALAALPPLTESDHVSAIVDYLGDADEEIRSAAAAALGRSDDDVVRPVLEGAVGVPHCRIAAAQALGMLGGERCEALSGLLDDADARVRATAADGLARCTGLSATPILAALRAEQDPATRQALILALGKAGGTEAVDELAGLCSDPDAEIRFTAVRALGCTGMAEAFPALLSALGDERSEVRAAALQAMGELGDVRAAVPLGAQLSGTDRDMRRTAAFALAKVAPAEAVHGLVGALGDGDREVRHAAVKALQRLDARGAASALQATAAGDSDPLIREAARAALSGFTADAGSAEGG
ncbi:MAG TPA: HEAT repeat domain-containing protein [Longimicrobiaceae bacterium]|nr:HEAT repeat domain-containing protein [Longimicrobiaceae bacterium]